MSEVSLYRDVEGRGAVDGLMVLGMEEGGWQRGQSCRVPRQSVGKGCQKSICPWALWLSEVICVCNDAFEAIYPPPSLWRGEARAVTDRVLCYFPHGGAAKYTPPPMPCRPSGPLGSSSSQQRRTPEIVL